MRRRLLNLLTVLSLLLCCAVGGAWVRSHRVTDVFRGDTTDPARRASTSYSVRSSGGSLFVSRMWGDVVSDEVYRFFERRRTVGWRYSAGVPQHGLPAEAEFRDDAARRWSALGLAVVARRLERPDYRSDYRALMLPYWLPASLTALLPAGRVFVAVRRGLRRRRAARRLEKVRRQICVSCGYDLRATPDRCPECGYTPKRAEA